MITHIFSVYDKAVNAYIQPFYARSKGEAIRSFTEAANDPQSNICKYATDMHLMYLGEFDDASGTFAPLLPERIVSATDVSQDTVITPRAPEGDRRALPEGTIFTNGRQPGR